NRRSYRSWKRLCLNHCWISCTLLIRSTVPARRIKARYSKCSLPSHFDGPNSRRYGANPATRGTRDSTRLNVRNTGIVQPCPFCRTSRVAVSGKTHKAFAFGAREGLKLDHPRSLTRFFVASKTKSFWKTLKGWFPSWHASGRKS